MDTSLIKHEIGLVEAEFVKDLTILTSANIEEAPSQDISDLAEQGGLHV